MDDRGNERPRDRSGDQEAFASYLRGVAGYGRIDHDEEVVLAARIKAGDEAALERMVLANLRLVLKIAYRYRSRQATFLDLVNEGNIGLIYASRKYDPRFGLRFSSYAVWWIKQAISLYLVQHAKGPISVPIRKVMLLQKINRESERMRSILGRSPTQEETARRMGLTTEVVEDAVRSVPEYTGWEDYLELHAGPSRDVEQDVDRRLCGDIIRKLMLDLPAHERLGMQLYFGLEGQAASNFAQIGRVLNMSREGARQLVKRSLDKLRALPGTRMLRAYVS